MKTLGTFLAQSISYYHDIILSIFIFKFLMIYGWHVKLKLAFMFFPECYYHNKLTCELCEFLETPSGFHIDSHGSKGPWSYSFFSF